MPVRHTPDRPTRVGPAAGRGIRRNSLRTLALLTLLGIATLPLGSCSTEYKPDEEVADETIIIPLGATDQGGRAFSPSPLYVLVGTKIIWVNDDSTAHRVADVSGRFTCPHPLASGERFSLVFKETGYYQYRCMMPGHDERGVIYVLP